MGIGIRVTKDVIREVCRIYAGDYHTIRDKWQRAIEQAALRKQREHDDLVRMINDTADAKDGGSSSADEKYHQVYAKYGGEYDSKSNEYDSDSKGVEFNNGTVRNADAKREKQADALILTGEEEDLGLDMSKLCDDIASGRGR